MAKKRSKVIHISSARRSEFRRAVRSFYVQNERSFPWRQARDPYKIFVSEIMLQQTQAGARTATKYEAFTKSFPSWQALAEAPLSGVLREWQGLGYNRRAKALREAARIIVRTHDGKLPHDEKTLQALPGVGPYTAAALLVFVHNKPALVIETNIRSVFIHHFFSRIKKKITDKDIVPCVEATLDRKNPREWYQALMDYGAHLKKKDKTLTAKSAHYVRQSSFEGSSRQIRGDIIRKLIDGSLTVRALCEGGKTHKVKMKEQLHALERDGLVQRKGECYMLT